MFLLLLYSPPMLRFSVSAAAVLTRAAARGVLCVVGCWNGVAASLLLAFGHNDQERIDVEGTTVFVRPFHSTLSKRNTPVTPSSLACRSPYCPCFQRRFLAA